MTVTMIPVESTTIASVGYDPAASALHVAFRSGSTYAYRPVPLHHYVGMLAASSAGGYHARFIKGQYAWTAAGGQPGALDLTKYTLDERDGFKRRANPAAEAERCDVCGVPAMVFASAAGSDEGLGQWCEAHAPQAERLTPEAAA